MARAHLDWQGPKVDAGAFCLQWSQVRGRFPWQSYRWRDRFVQLYDNKIIYFEDEHAAGGPRGQFALDVRCDVCLAFEHSTGAACWQSVHVRIMEYGSCRGSLLRQARLWVLKLSCNVVAHEASGLSACCHQQCLHLLLAAAVALHHQNDLQGCIVWEEGRKKAHYWTFNLVRETKEGETVSMLRCSTEVRETYERWIQVGWWY